MGNKLYVGNLPYAFRDSDLEQTFGQYGSVSSAKVMMERDTGRSKGFGFVEMGSDAEAQAAIQGVHVGLGVLAVAGVGARHAVEQTVGLVVAHLARRYPGAPGGLADGHGPIVSGCAGGHAATV